MCVFDSCGKILGGMVGVGAVKLWWAWPPSEQAERVAAYAGSVAHGAGEGACSAKGRDRHGGAARAARVVTARLHVRALCGCAQRRQRRWRVSLSVSRTFPGFAPGAVCICGDRRQTSRNGLGGFSSSSALMCNLGIRSTVRLAVLLDRARAVSAVARL